jgi:hypothetical protein
MVVWAVTNAIEEVDLTNCPIMVFGAMDGWLLGPLFSHRPGILTDIVRERTFMENECRL